MARERLYVIHGAGPDRVGLVGTISGSIARAGGNIVDLRQDVLHGLFTLFMVVDLSGTELRAAELSRMAKELCEDTGLELRVDTYNPIAHGPKVSNLLLVLIGRDRPGIISSITETLAKYRINIERAQTIARENVFLMELMCDIGACSIPLANARDVLRSTMASVGISTMFQAQDVFNKKKRVILFDIRANLLGPSALREILSQCRLDVADLRAMFESGPHEAARAAARMLDGVGADSIDSVAGALAPSAGAVELVQTCKTMGYTAALCCDAFTPLLKVLCGRLAIERLSGIELAIDNDSRTVCGELPAEARSRTTDAFVASLMRAESVDRADITVVSHTGSGDIPGIRIEPDLSAILGLFNSRSLSRENLLGILAGLGAPAADL